ncbi:alpha/beta hydrolase [Halosquirtibacter laminarini]|uniref:Alpha/beta hydrolase n=1 Tax=Halosquirtibacter laminarini TaxID=3374600 RepID=A0AC61NP45_9BACT|nr:alpha/beta hydrolase [Prolixibacteraceae bacterium]
MKKIKVLIVCIIFLIVGYFVGPKMEQYDLSLELPNVDKSGKELEEWIQQRESKVNIKDDNEARIIWNNPNTKEATDYVLLYLHGFSASWYEGAPINMNIANDMKANAFFARLHDHGLVEDNPLLDMKPNLLYDSAKEALMIAHQLGKKVIIMSTSTGGTLSLKLAADFPELVDGLILYSPNIVIKQAEARLLSKPWGLDIAKMAMGGNFRTFHDTGKIAQYWYQKYRVEGMVYLQQLLDQTMNKETFSKVTCPTFVGAYYKDEKHEDNTVSVKAIKEMIPLLGSEKKELILFPNADTHVIANGLQSHSWVRVEKMTLKFIQENILKSK